MNSKIMARFLAPMTLASSIGAWGAADVAPVRPEPLQRAAVMNLADAMSGAQARSRVAAVTGPKVAVLVLDQSAYAALKPQTRITVSLPIESDQSLSLELERFDVLTPDAVIVSMGENGETRLPRPDVQLWRGRVAGDDESRVFLGLTPDGAQGYVVSGDQTYSISTVPLRVHSPLAGRTVVVEAHALQAAQRLTPGAVGPVPCAGAILPPGVKAPPVNTGQGAPVGNGAALGLRSSSPCRAIRVAMDTDNEFLNNLFGGDTAKATAYITLLMGASSSIYERDLIVQLQVPFMRVWTTTDPWSGTDTPSQLTQFRSYWNANQQGTQRDIAHLLSGRGLGGGIAYLSVLCNLNVAYGVSANLAGTFPFPVQDNSVDNWDLNVVSHEIGHNFSTGHTHDPNAYNPTIDGCGYAYLNPPLPQDCTVAQAHNGTIMSYCHICPGGEANLKMTFGPRPIRVMWDYLATDAQDCGITNTALSIQDIQFTSGSTCPGGSVTITPYVTGPNIVYSWYHDGVLIPGQTAATLTLNNLDFTSQGTYWPVISNQCGQADGYSIDVFLCFQDFNCSGTVTVQDLFDYLSAWFAHSPKANINGVSGVTIQDLFDFLGLWFNGPC